MFYVFIGQNATTGTPHPKTGNMSYWGDIAVFSTEQKRQDFIDNFRPNNPSVFVRACSKRGAREYNLGISVRMFNEYLDSLDVDSESEDL